MELIIAYYLTKKITEKSILVMGPKGSGKTTLIDLLNNFKNLKSEDPFSWNPFIPPYVYWYYKIIRRILADIVEKSVFTDTEGTDCFQDYNESYSLLKEKKYDYVIYVYDISKVLENEEDYINTILKRDFPKLKRSKVKGVILMGTHVDKTSKTEEEIAKHESIKVMEETLKNSEKKHSSVYLNLNAQDKSEIYEKIVRSFATIG